MGLFTGGFKLLIGMGTGTYATQCRKYLGNVNVEGVEIDDAEFAKHVIKEIGM